MLGHLGLRLKHPQIDYWFRIIKHLLLLFIKVSVLRAHHCCRCGPGVSARVFRGTLGCLVNVWGLEKPLGFPASGAGGIAYSLS